MGEVREERKPRVETKGRKKGGAERKVPVSVKEKEYGKERENGKSNEGIE